MLVTIQVSRQLTRAQQPCLNNIEIHWRTDTPSSVHQSPYKVLSVFSGERVLIFGFIPFDCHQVLICCTAFYIHR